MLVQSGRLQYAWCPTGMETPMARLARCKMVRTVLYQVDLESTYFRSYGLLKWTWGGSTSKVRKVEASVRQQKVKAKVDADPCLFLMEASHFCAQARQALSRALVRSMQTRFALPFLFFPFFPKPLAATKVQQLPIFTHPSPLAPNSVRE